MTILSTLAGLVFFGGFDRFKVFYSKAKTLLVKDAKKPADALKGIGGLAAEITFAPYNECKAMSMRLNGNGAARKLAVWDLDGDEAKGLERSTTAETESLSESGFEGLTATGDDEEACLPACSRTNQRLIDVLYLLIRSKPSETADWKKLI